MGSSMDVLIVGAGVFGTTGAIALAERGHAVRLIDPGPLPHPFAASTDRSKMVRPDYGGDPIYTDLGIEAIEGWHRWNDKWGRALYHEDGILMRTRGPMTDDGFEGRSFASLKARGVPVERIDQAGMKAFPAWSAFGYPDGYLNRRAGWADAEEVMKALHADARAAGVRIETDRAAIELIEEDGRVTGVLTAEAVQLEAEMTVVATGSWAPVLVPELNAVMQAVGQPSLVFRVNRPLRWQPPDFVPWAADLAEIGWYGFPARADGTIKIARHAIGVKVPAGSPRVVSPEMVGAGRAFLSMSFPELAAAPLVTTRMCAYCDTFDGHWWIDRDPRREGLVVAAGGSGHAFKFAPILGARIAAAVEGRRDDVEPRFHWRSPTSESKASGQVRH